MASIKKRPEKKTRAPLPRSKAAMGRYEQGLYTPHLRIIDRMFRNAGKPSPVRPEALEGPRKKGK